MLFQCVVQAAHDPLQGVELFAPEPLGEPAGRTGGDPSSCAPRKPHLSSRHDRCPRARRLCLWSVAILGGPGRRLHGQAGGEQAAVQHPVLGVLRPLVGHVGALVHRTEDRGPPGRTRGRARPSSRSSSGASREARRPMPHARSRDRSGSPNNRRPTNDPTSKLDDPRLDLLGASRQRQCVGPESFA